MKHKSRVQAVFGYAGNWSSFSQKIEKFVQDLSRAIGFWTLTDKWLTINHNDFSLLDRLVNCMNY